MPFTPSPVTPTRTRRIAFAETVEIIPISSPLESLLIEEQQIGASSSWKRALWYQPSDLAQFRQEVRHYAAIVAACMNGTGAVPLECEMTARILGDEFRGLESRFCMERARRKAWSNRLILRAFFRMSHDRERFAAVAQKFTAWATDLAVHDAAWDTFRAYGNEKEVAAAVTDVPYWVLLARSNCNKRAASEEVHLNHGRRVRPRI